jgi:hypothetical protein
MLQPHILLTFFGVFNEIESLKAPKQVVCRLLPHAMLTHADAC